MSEGSTAAATPGAVTSAKEIFVEVNERRVGPFFTDDVTGLDIKTKGGFDPNSDLFQKRGNQLVPVQNSETIEIHEGEEFVDLVSTPVS